MNKLTISQSVRASTSRCCKSICLFTTALSLLAASTAHAWPTGSRGGSFFFGGSSLTLLWQTVDSTDNLATIQLNYFEADERLCFTGEVKGLYSDGTMTGEAIYELLGVDGASLNTTGICYSYVAQACDQLLDQAGNPVNLSPGFIEECTYTVPKLEDITDLDGLLSGRLRTVPGSGTGYLAACDSATPPRICDFQVGIGFNNSIPPAFFPATVTTDGDAVAANVVLYSNEICTQFNAFDDLNLAPTAALSAKSATLRSCEALAIKGDWCSDLQSNMGDPKCDATNANGQFTVGGFNNSAGDFLVQTPFSINCISSIEDLRNLESCAEVNLAACGDGSGLLEMPTTYDSGGTTCGANVNSIEFTYSSSDGGGVDYLNVASILNFGSPGNPGDNSTPPCTSACIVSTPSNNEVNTWNFSSTTLQGIGFIDGRNNDDIITGSQGPDTIRGGSGADTLNGAGGNDILQGGDNADTLNGDDGDDLLLGYDCYGPNADCSVVSNNGSDDDILNGGPGNDCLDGGRGNDTATGGEGSDAFVLYGNVDKDIITDFNIEEDVFVDLTGNATAIWVQGKRGAPSVCTISTGGNDVTTVEGIGKGDCKKPPLTILDPSAGDDFPTQCAGHPYSFQ